MIIESIEQLKDLSVRGLECHIRLNGGLKSSKHITYIDGDDVFEVINYIDDTEQVLTSKDIFNEDLTNIGKAITLKALHFD